MDEQSMFDRVVRVIGEAYDGSADPIETPNNWARAVCAAKAVFEVMHAPTEAMMTAHWRRSRSSLDGLGHLDAEAVQSWRAMIDAIHGPDALLAPGAKA